MFNRAFIVVILLLAMVTLATGSQNNSSYQKFVLQGDLEAAKIINPSDPADFDIPRNAPRRDEPAEVAIGEATIVGYTYYDYQHNGSIGKMITVDGDGNIHMTWMNGFDRNLAQRHQTYNYIDENGDLLERPNDRIIIDEGGRSGYGVISYVPEDNRGVSFYHVTGFLDNNPNYLGCGMSVDWLAGLGAYTAFYGPTPEDVMFAWPKGTMDLNNVAHMVATENTAEDVLAQRVGYARGVPDRNIESWDFDNEWTDVDVTGVISSVVANSIQSEKVAIVWHHNLIGPDLDQPNGDWDQARGGWQRNNDIRYIISENGEDWDFEDDWESMTKIIPPNPDLVEENFAAAYGDTFRPYCDVDIAFDPWDEEDGDALYGVFAASGFQEEPVEDDDPEPVDLVYAVQGHLWFWNSVEDTITMIYDGWYNQFMQNDNAPEGRNFRCGVWRLNADRGSIAFDPDNPGHIYVVWEWCRPIMEVLPNEQGQLEPHFYENAQDTTEMGYVNKEVMVSVSTDYGISWHEPFNITETIWDEDDAPEPGDSQSEDWVSVAPYVSDGALHILYILDLDAGGIAQEEGAVTNNPVIYHRVEIEDLDVGNRDLVELPREGFMFHNYPQEEEPDVRDLEVDLAEGWNMISINVAPSEDLWERNEGPDVELMLEPIVDELRLFKDGQGRFYAPEWDFNNIPYWDLTQGFLVKVEDDMEITWTGEPIPADTDIDLDEGWNMIAYFPQYRLDADAPDFYVLSPIIDNVLIAKDGMGRFLSTAFDFSNMLDWRETEGYLVKTDDAVTLNYPEEQRILASVGRSERESTPLVPSWRNMSVLVERVHGIEIEHDPQILAIDSENNIVGNGTLQSDGRCGLAVWEDDSATEGIEGLVVGESFKLVLQTDHKLFDLSPVSIMEGRGLVYEPNGFTVLEMQAQVELPTDFYLADVYPNPFNNKTRISFGLPQSETVVINVFDLNGRLVSEILNNSLDAGHHLVTFDASDLAAGSYVVRMSAGDFSGVRKVLLMK